MREPYFPVCLDLVGRRCLVVGSNAEAARRSAMVERAGAIVVRLAALAGAPVELDGMALVVISGAPYDQAAALSRRCQDRFIPVNVVDEPTLCSFVMPALVERGSVTVAISTGGRSPLLAKLLRQAIDRILPARLGDLAELAGEARPLVRERIADPSHRLRLWVRVLTGPVAALALAGRKDAARAALAGVVAAASKMRRAA
ncbi:MAG TPA: bifunctional precorrin-2 dehydrogenase/sirohydrochlorin ferrochelatase [Stellaceae bacterium]|nr:bifunctional precorrin-2 dehydrogenase/sirohydrochlorin ferrochelatase [Stellaceae bacterium]